MKINLMCFDLSGYGGTEKAIVTLANYFVQKEDLEITLVLSNIPKNQDWLLNLDKSVIVKKTLKNKKLSKLILFTQCFFRANNDDVFIILGANTIKFAYQIRKLLHKKWRIVSWMHFSLFGQDWFNPYNLLYADEHLSISSKITRELQKIGVKKSLITTIYNEVDKHKLLLQKPSSQINIAFAGRVMLDSQKNLRELFQAIKLSKKNIHLDIYGTGDIEGCTSYLNTLGIIDKVKWHGWVKNPIESLKYRPDYFVLTSKFEGLPMILLEALSFGIPCICSNFDGYDDVIQEGVNGFSYKLGHPQQLASLFDQCKNVHFDEKRVANSINKFYADSYYTRLDGILNRWHN